MEINNNILKFLLMNLIKKIINMIIFIFQVNLHKNVVIVNFGLTEIFFYLKLNYQIKRI